MILWLSSLVLLHYAQATTNILTVKRVTPSTVATPTGDPNFEVIRPFANQHLADAFTNPYLMCDEWGSPVKELGKPAIDPGPPATTGKPHVGWHPHRGFDLLSVIKEGRGSHADSLGNVEIVRPGGIQWMRSGSGIEHAEGGGNPKGAAKHGFQIWINLPSHLKMSVPKYGTVQPEDIPKEDNTRIGGAMIHYLAGLGTPMIQAASFQERKDFTIIDVELPRNSTQIITIPLHFERVIAYSYRNTCTVAGRIVQPQKAATLTIGAIEVDAVGEQPEDDSESSRVATVELEGGSNGCAILIFAAKPMLEPIAWRGPIVMNTQAEIQQAYRDLRSGNFLKKSVGYDYRKRALT